MEPEAMAMFRVLGGGLAFLPFAWRHLRRDLSALDTKGRWLLFLAGFFLAVHFICWMQALRLTSVGSSVMALCTQPVFAAIVGHFFINEKFKASTAVALLITVAGLTLIGVNDFQQPDTNALGVILAVFASLFITLCIACGKIVRRRMHILSYSSAVFLTAGLLLSPTLFLHARMITAYEPMQWFWLGMIILVPTIMGHTMFYWVIKYFKIITVNLSVLIEPVLAVIAAAIILGEVPQPLFYCGGAIIMGGVLYHLLAEARENRLRAVPTD
jgi:drug/metabolite transporter (DMT)-like permease